MRICSKYLITLQMRKAGVNELLVTQNSKIWTLVEHDYDQISYKRFD